MSHNNDINSGSKRQVESLFQKTMRRHRAFRSHYGSGDSVQAAHDASNELTSNVFDELQEELQFQKRKRTNRALIRAMRNQTS